MSKSKCSVVAGGTKCWYDEQALLHREDGPAVEHPAGHKAWYRNGQLHREDGPAVEFPGGGVEWWLNGKECTQEQIDIITLAEFGRKANE
jgi:hypothetical protein